MLIAGNWKMFKGPAEARAFLDAFQPPEGVDVVVCPPFVSLAAAVESGARVYAQNVHWEPQGAYTGEVSRADAARARRRGRARRPLRAPPALRRERRDGRAPRARTALDEGLGVIACVGETLEQRESGDTELVLKIQVEAIAFAAGEHERPRDRLRAGLGDRHRQDRHARAGGGGAALHQGRCSTGPVLYGGSVKPENAAELLAQPSIDGALVGGASLEPDSFAAICRAASTS